MIVPAHPGDPGDSYRPLLAAVVHGTTGPVLELGAGRWSTPLLAELCGPQRAFLSIETDATWAMAAALAAPSALVLRAATWDAALSWLDTIGPPQWGVVFVDLSPGHDRRRAVERLRARAQVVVVHDTEPDKYYAYHFDGEFWQGFKHVLHDDRLPVWTTAASDELDLAFLELEGK